MIELDYYGFMKYVLLKCDQFDVNNGNNGIKIGEHGFSFVNTNKFMYSNELHRLALRHVSYVEDPLEKDQHVVMKNASGDLYNILEKI